MLEKLFQSKEVVVALVVGLASLAIAYSTFSGALWNSNAVENYSKGTAMTVEANTTYIAATLNWNESTEEERKTELGRYEEEIGQAEEKVKTVDAANKNSDTYQFFSVMFGAVAFFASLAGTTNKKNLVTTILLIAIVGFVVLLGFVLGLPKPSFSF